jgi:exportin-7
MYPSKKNAVAQSGGDLFLQVLKQHPEILQQILSTVLNVIMFEDCRNQWSMSRPLLGLILLNEEVSIYYIYQSNLQFATN